MGTTALSGHDDSHKADLEHFDALVVGSGFGGSVTAYRLAEAGLRVCLLERGKAYPPGSFPRRPREMARNFWDPSEGLYGLFDIWTFRGLEAIVASGLGGGSLIYANVLIRKDERWFVQGDSFNGGIEHWPVKRSDLDAHYERVEQWLGATPYPFEVAPYSSTPKTVALKYAADRSGIDWQLPKLAVTFQSSGEPPVPGEPIKEGENMHGRTRYTCRLCGECDIGCNFGSKNSLDFNYLTAFARMQNSVIRTRCEVKSFEPRAKGGFTVRYLMHDPQREGRPGPTDRLPLTTVTADRLVLAAGSLGTPYLLLRNRAAFPLITAALGTRFCGNGDLLGLLSRARKRQGHQIVPRPLDPSFGPAITSAVRVSDALDGGRGRGFYIEDGGYPQIVDWMIEAADVPGSLRRALRFVARRIWNRLSGNPISSLSAEIASLLGEGVRSSTVLPLLGMGRDIPDGMMHLRRGRFLDIDWTTKTSRAYFAGVRATMSSLAEALESRYRDNPLWYFRRVITVHPLGGCPMGRDPEEGVVDAHGQVFGYPGLSIADGSVMPGPVGPNPSLTIAALADRFADRTIELSGVKA